MKVTRVPKLEAADLLGVSPRTVDRMIARGELETEREETGRRRVMVMIEQGRDEREGGHGSLINGNVPSPGSMLDVEHPERNGGGPDPREDFSGMEVPTRERLELIAARERIRSLEELAGFHKEQLNLAEGRNQHLVQLLRSNQETVDRLTLALPPGRSRPWWKFW